uniref:DDE Tnp4 domain-containing protein n=1 Tax=Oryza meridionalis TaxID=40149 RepID=A0A0E0E1Y4_9ORYZ
MLSFSLSIPPSVTAARHLSFLATDSPVAGQDKKLVGKVEGNSPDIKKQNCIASIDGTHIPVTIDGEKAAPYRNKNGTLSQNFIVPYRGVRYLLKEFGRGHRRPRDCKELFHHRHAILRNHVERDLGVLKKRFPILKVGTFHRIKNQMRVPATPAVFHNMVWMLNSDEGWLDNQPDNIEPDDFVDLPEGDMEVVFESPEDKNKDRD